MNEMLSVGSPELTVWVLLLATVLLNPENVLNVLDHEPDLWEPYQTLLANTKLHKAYALYPLHSPLSSCCLLLSSYGYHQFLSHIARELGEGSNSSEEENDGLTEEEVVLAPKKIDFEAAKSTERPTVPAIHSAPSPREEQDLAEVKSALSNDY